MAWKKEKTFHIALAVKLSFTKKVNHGDVGSVTLCAVKLIFTAFCFYSDVEKML